MNTGFGNMECSLADSGPDFQGEGRGMSLGSAPGSSQSAEKYKPFIRAVV